MRSSDRFGGGYVNYTTRKAPYELSRLTKEAFDRLSRGTTQEQLQQFLTAASDSELALLRTDIGVAKLRLLAKPEAQEVLSVLDRMASAELENRQPGRALFAKILDLAGKGADIYEIQRLLTKAETDALVALPKYLDKLVSDVRPSQPKKTSWAAGIKKALRLSRPGDDADPALRLEVMVEDIRAMSSAVLDQRAKAQR